MNGSIGRATKILIEQYLKTTHEMNNLHPA